MNRFVYLLALFACSSAETPQDLPAKSATTYLDDAVTGVTNPALRDVLERTGKIDATVADVGDRSRPQIR